MISASNDTLTTLGGSSDDWVVREVGNFLSEAQVWQQAVLGNGSDVTVALYVSDSGQFRVPCFK